MAARDHARRTKRITHAELSERGTTRSLITGIQFEHFVIGYPRDFHVNYARFNGFLHNILQFSKFMKSTTDVSVQKKLILERHFYFRNLLSTRALALGASILKLLARVLPELYSTWYNYYYKLAPFR